VVQETVAKNPLYTNQLPPETISIAYLIQLEKKKIFLPDQRSYSVPFFLFLKLSLFFHP